MVSSFSSTARPALLPPWPRCTRPIAPKTTPSSYSTAVGLCSSMRTWKSGRSQKGAYSADWRSSLITLASTRGLLCYIPLRSTDSSIGSSWSIRHAKACARNFWTQPATEEDVEGITLDLQPSCRAAASLQRCRRCPRWNSGSISTYQLQDWWVDGVS